MAISRLYTPAKLFSLALLAAATPAFGSAASPCQPHAITRTSTKSWGEPLARAVTLSAGEVSLKDALEKLADAAHLRFSYSTELLPLERRVCASYAAVPVGDALLDMLRGVSVEPVIAGSDHIVLAPSSTPLARSDDLEPSPIFPLAPVVATATSQEPDQQQHNFAYTVVRADQIAQQGSVAGALNAHVPGLWAWQSPTGFTSVFTSRGASSFGVSAPKIYIDGIEVANPLLAAQIAPENIDHIEVIRGPQGAALYGADALNGVTNIVTRHDVGGAGAPHLRVRSGLAVSQTDFTAGSAVGQDHSASLQVGTRTRSANLNLGIGSVGEYMPGAFARHLSGDGSVRMIASRTTLSATARVYSQSAGSPASLLMDSASYNITPLSMRQYTTGFKAVFRQNDAVTHSLIVGIDGYSFGNAQRDTMAPLTASDSVLRAWDSGLRTTLRFATVAQLDVGANARAALTFAAEHSGLHQRGTGSAAMAYGGGLDMARHPAEAWEAHQQVAEENEYLSPSGSYENSRSSNGVSAQFDAALHERFFLNGGLRIEHDFVNGAGEGTAVLPILGMSYLLRRGDLTMKLRGAYGKGVRWPEMPRLENSYAHARIVRPALSPEQQSGIEAGVDVAFKEMLGVQITRYNQTATGLSQMVALPRPQNAPETWSGFALQNVGAIANRGWELQAYARRGALSLTGTMAFTDSRVQRVANGYTGDLRSGDRMLGVPARTIGIDASWTTSQWSTSVTAARALDWLNYDRKQLAQLAEQPVGPTLRNYWQAYNGFTHVRATVSRNITRDITLMLIGDNLLDQQIGEPDNLTVVPGRTISFGVKASF